MSIRNFVELQMPQYVGHKTVGALQIRSIEPMDGGTHRLCFHGTDQMLTTEPGWVERHGAQAGGYFVKYEDGYRSWSPQAAFDKAYTPQDQWGIGAAQESKYFINAVGRLANRKTGIAIPDEEPVITFRAKDALLPTVLRFYASQLPPGEHRDAVETQLHRVEEFQAAFRAFVRIPD
jgi:hypothetical protein